MSPFLMSTQSGNSAGFFGIQSLDATINFVGNDFLRALRTAPAAPITSVQFGITQGQTYLDFVYMTPQASQRLPARNVIPYLQLQNSVMNIQGTTDITGSVPLSVVSNTYQLNMIPDSVIVCARKKANTQTMYDADCYLPFCAQGATSGSTAGGISINFANTPGILAGNTISSLWEYSNNAGTVQDFVSFSGWKTQKTALTDGAGSGVEQIATTGPILNLKFGSAINLVSDWNAPSSIGNYSFQISCNVYNNTGAAFNAGDYELLCVFVNSGLIVSSLGSTSVYSGLLTKQDVLDATTKPTVNQGEYKRMYGAGWWSGIKSAVSTAIAAAPTLMKAAPHVMGAYKAITGNGMAAGRSGSGYSGSAKLKDANRFY
jgi:hypothetical protein